MIRGGLAAGLFHHLADEELEGFFFAVLEVADRGGVFGEDAVDEGLKGGGIGHGGIVGVRGDDLVWCNVWF